MHAPLLRALLIALVLSLPSVGMAGAMNGLTYGAAGAAWPQALLYTPVQLADTLNDNEEQPKQVGATRLPGDSPHPDKRMYDFDLPGETDRKGLNKDTYYFVFSQFFVIGILYVMPEDVSGWTEEQKDDFTFSKWTDNVTDITWDSDKWWINYILHPYWGGAYYVRATERGYGENEAFWYSMMLSLIYEYGAEAIFETPSVQDIILTPGIGFFYGKYMMSLRNDIRAQLRAGHRLTTGDRVILFATDPLGAVNKGFDWMFGIEGDYMFSPFMVASSGQVGLRRDDLDDRPWTAVANKIVPGFQLNMRW